MAIGIIGLGRLGAALARGLIGAGVPDVYAFSRTASNAAAVAAQAPGLQLLDSATAVLEHCDLVFVWMAPPDAATVFEANAELLRTRNPLVVTCSPGQDVGQFTTRWAETLPNVALSTGQGVTLVTWGPELSVGDQASVRAALGACGAVYEVSAQDLPFYCALASNGPAFYALAAETWADQLADQRGFDRELCRQMVRQTVLGTFALQEADGIDATEVIRRVAHPGGSTEKGLRVLDANLAEIGRQVLQAMGKW